VRGVFNNNAHPHNIFAFYENQAAV
jgi:hypothetical protein